MWPSVVVLVDNGVMGIMLGANLKGFYNKATI